MRNSSNRKLTAVGIIFCSLSIPALAQRSVSVFTPSVPPADQNAPSITSPENPGNQLNSESDGVAPVRAWNIVPRVGLTETLTDNINLASTNQQNGVISQVSPGIRIDARTARLKMFLDYQLDGLAYSSGSNSTRAINTLNTFGTLEAIDNWFFLDFSGVVSQQIINQFGQQSSSNIYNTGNTTQYSTFKLSPYIKGQLAGSTDYLLRYNALMSNSGSSSISDITISEWLGRINGNTNFENLNWAIDGSKQDTNYSQVGLIPSQDYSDNRLRALLIYKLFPEFRVSASGGGESNNYQSSSNESNSIYGAGVEWTPTERTVARGFWENRFFGTGHDALLSHRFPLSSIRYIDTRDVVLIPQQFTNSGLGTIYDQYSQIFTSLIPDPASRDAYVRNLLDQSGTQPNAQAINNYLANRPQVQRNQQFSMVFYGSRNSLTFIAGRNYTEPLTRAPNGLNSLVSQAGTITQQGYAVSYSHRLTPLTGLNLQASRQKNQSGISNAIDTTLTSYVIGFATRLTAKTFGTIYVRHQDFTASDLVSTPYKENALIASVNMVF